MGVYGLSMLTFFHIHVGINNSIHTGIHSMLKKLTI